MKKTTVYLSDDLSEALHRAAERESRSEAELIREGIALVIRESAPRPTVPLFESGRPDFANTTEVDLSEFGTD